MHFLFVKELLYVMSVVAVALAEHKLTMEHFHKAAVEELQNKLMDKEIAYRDQQRKLINEKELAVAEAKKRQWVLLARIDLSCVSYAWFPPFCCHCIVPFCHS